VRGHNFRRASHTGHTCNHHRRPILYRINFHLVLNAAYSCPSSIDSMHWSLKISTPENARQRLVTSKTPCTMQPFHTSLVGAQWHFVNAWTSSNISIAPTRLPHPNTHHICGTTRPISCNSICYEYLCQKCCFVNVFRGLSVCLLQNY